MAHGLFVAQRKRANLREIGIYVHGASASNAGKATVHFGADAAGSGAVGHFAWPELFVGKFFGSVLCNGQCVPYGQVAIDQHGYFAHGVDVFQGLLELRLLIKPIKAHHDFFKRNARLLEHDPGSH